MHSLLKIFSAKKRKGSIIQINVLLIFCSINNPYSISRLFKYDKNVGWLRRGSKELPFYLFVRFASAARGILLLYYICICIYHVLSICANMAQQFQKSRFAVFFKSRGYLKRHAVWRIAASIKRRNVTAGGLAKITERYLRDPRLYDYYSMIRLRQTQHLCKSVTGESTPAPLLRAYVTWRTRASARRSYRSACVFWEISRALSDPQTL